MDDRDEMLSAMYAQDEEETGEKRPQPEQLRLAGKATLIQHGDKNLAVPRIEYVDELQGRITAQEKQIEALVARIKKLELNVNRMMNIAIKRIGNVESDIQAAANKRPWE